MVEYQYNAELTRKNFEMLWNRVMPIPIECYAGEKKYLNQSLIILTSYDTKNEEMGDEHQFLFWPEEEDDTDWFIPFDLEEVMGHPVQWVVEEVIRHCNIQLLFDDQGRVSLGWWKDEPLEE